MAGEEGECPVSVTPGLQRSEPGQGREPGPGEEGRGLVAMCHVSSGPSQSLWGRMTTSRTEPVLALCQMTTPRSDNIGRPGSCQLEHGTHATCKNMKNGRSKESNFTIEQTFI